MKSSEVEKAGCGLNRAWGRSHLFIAALLLAGAVEATVQAGEKDAVKALRQLEDDMAQAWVQRDTRALDGILADDYTLGGAGDSFVNKEQYVAGVDDPESRTTSAILDDLRIRVYDDAAVVTGRAIYRGLVKTGRKLRSSLQVYGYFHPA
jgi:hypothetical protein